jgi:hypothetical protein
MSHEYHDALLGYSPAQVWHDHCGECEARGANLAHGIGCLDEQNFAKAWARAAAWNREGVPDLSQAERPLLQVLWSIQLQFERRGVPIGELPGRLGALEDLLAVYRDSFSRERP